MPKTFSEFEGAYARLEGGGRHDMALMLRDASQRAWAVEAPALASRCDAPQHEGKGARVVPARGTPRQQKRVYARLRRAMRRGDPVAGTHDQRRWLWVPALAALGRDDDGLARAEHQPAAARNRDWGNFHCFQLILSMEIATPTCSASEAQITPICHPRCGTIRLCHHPSSSCGTIRRNPMCHHPSS